MRITILGSGGGAPSGVRETASLLIREDDRALLLDAGTGARRLVTDSRHLDGVGHLDVVLTHFHLDHVCGLPLSRHARHHGGDLGTRRVAVRHGERQHPGAALPDHAALLEDAKAGFARVQPGWDEIVLA